MRCSATDTSMALILRLIVVPNVGIQGIVKTEQRLADCLACPNHRSQYCNGDSPNN